MQVVALEQQAARMEATLKIHNSDFSEDDLILNSKGFSDIQPNDIVKVCHKSNGCPDPTKYIIIKGVSFKDGGELRKDTISMAQHLATSFGFNVYQTVYVCKEKISNVTLDLIEVTFKDQYISRSDMWRLKKNLVGSIAYYNQKIEYADIRAQVNDLWVHTVKVQCGLITDETKIVLRSASALVYIFIQMSSEMWDFDAYGQLNYENATNGFLKELFLKWKDKCCHEITVVLFSRTIYETKDYNSFPEWARHTVQEDFKGRLYIDFYKSIVQNERRDDCSPLLRPLKKLFHNYLDFVLDPRLPKGFVSISSEGNFLEAMNMALNVFEKHYVNRNFERTGQLVMCITPGVGVFNVDRDLTVLTKERMIDDGIGSDLVCLGQQPLHAVPLFIFHTKSKKQHKHAQDYDFNVPHWINHSFYSSNPFLDKGTTGIKHVPRIHLASKKKSTEQTVDCLQLFSPVIADKNHSISQLPAIPQLDYEEYDRQAFSLPRTSSATNLMAHKTRHILMSRTIAERRHSARNRTISDEWRSNQEEDRKNQLLRTNSPSSLKNSIPIPTKRDEVWYRKFDSSGASSVGAVGSLEKYITRKKPMVKDASTDLIVGSANTTQQMPKKSLRRALINPFVASYSFEASSNRQRWGHTFPRGPQGEMLIQHYQYPSNGGTSMRSRESSECLDDDVYAPNSSTQYSNVHALRAQMSPAKKSGVIFPDPARTSLSSIHGSDISSASSEQLSSSPTVVPLQASPPFPLLNTGRHSSTSSYINSLVHEIELLWRHNFPYWTSDLTIGVDWKSLRFPACLPITNDSFPQKHKLQTDYLEQLYPLICLDSSQQDSRSSTRENFLELVNQRLCQGFQLVVGENKQRQHYNSTASYGTNMSASPVMHETSFGNSSISPPFKNSEEIASMRFKESYKLNHGRQYHIVKLENENDISVMIYRPRHPSRTVHIDYKYMLWPTTGVSYEPCYVKFDHERLEKYYWNYLDNYICLHNSDDDNFQMTTNMKYWRTKFVVITSPNIKLQQLKSYNEGKTQDNWRYDAFDYKRSSDCDTTLSDSDLMGMIKFIEHINRVKRPHSSGSTKSLWRSSANLTSKSTSTHSINQVSASVSSVQLFGTNHTSPTPPSIPSGSGRTTPIKSHETAKSVPSNMTSLQDSQSLPMPSPLKQVVATDKESSSLNTSSENHLLTSSSSISDIITEMKQAVVCFPPTRDIPEQWFISFDAAHWALENITGINSIHDCIHLFQKMCTEEYICHGSSNTNHPFIYGYYIYFLTGKKNDESEDSILHQYEPHAEHSAEFFNHWTQVEITDDDSPAQLNSFTQNRPKSVLSYQLEKESEIRSAFTKYDEKKKDTKFLKHMHHTIDVPMNNKSKTARSEWFRLLYQTQIHKCNYSLSFIFKLQWLVATATCVFDKVQGWAREARKCGLFLLPMPSDPFAFPHTQDTVCPLQSPLFIPINLQQIADNSPRFEEMRQNGSEYWKMIINLLEGIAFRFGFVSLPYGLLKRCTNKTDSYSESGYMNSRYYVHYTGQCFLQIPINKAMHVHHCSETSKIMNLFSPNISGTLYESLSNSNNTPDSKKSFNISCCDGTNVNDVGFYWSKNFMFNKQWRPPTSDVDCPLDALENDLTNFCNDDENRLYTFYINS